MSSVEAQGRSTGDEISDVPTEAFADFLVDDRVSSLPGDRARPQALRDIFLVFVSRRNGPLEETVLYGGQRGAALDLFADLFIDPGTATMMVGWMEVMAAGSLSNVGQ